MQTTIISTNFLLERIELDVSGVGDTEQQCLIVVQGQLETCSCRVVSPTVTDKTGLFNMLTDPLKKIRTV